MLDLSFLTEEEQEAIMQVLQRDADLKKAEEDRVRTLEETIEDTNELKNKTGQWFYEAKSKRHRDKIHGADLIRASIRKKKPQTLAELSQSRNDKTKKSWVNNVNKDLFLPPELVGVMEEPEQEDEDEEEQTDVQLYRSAPRVDSLALSENDSSVLKAVSSPSRQRKNPFNNPTFDNNLELTTENQISQNGTPHLYETPGKDILAPSQKSKDIKIMPTIEFNEVGDISAVDGAELLNDKPVPKPKARTVTYKISDLQSDSDSSLTKPAKRNDSMNGTGARRGILKRSPSSSSTDSEILRVSLDTQSKPPASPILEGEVEQNHLGEQEDHSSQNSLDRLKQVRFTPVDVPDALPQTPDSHNGREIGEFDLLESDDGQLITDDIDGFKHKDNKRHTPVQLENEKLDSDVPAAVSEGEHGDRSLKMTLPSLSANLENNLKPSPGPKAELVPNRNVTSVQPLPANSEPLQKRGASAEDTNIKRPNGISVSILEDGAPTIETTLNKESTDLSDNERHTSKLKIDQQPIYTKIKSPRVPNLDPVNITKGNSSVDETQPSCKTETVLVDRNLPKPDDKRDHSNVSLQALELQSNAKVPVGKQLRTENSKNIRDQQPLHAEIKSPQVSELNSTDHPQGSEEDSNLVLTVLRRSSTNPVSSKHLEDIPSAASMPETVDVPEKVDVQKEEFVRSAENDNEAEPRDAFYETIPDRSTLPAYTDNRFQDPEKLKRLSKSVPDFLQDESDDRETDSTSEGSFPLGRLKKTPSSLTNLSGSSGMASLSSVSGSVMSIYSGDFGNLDVKGNIQFAIDYVEQLQEFHIFVAQCKELAVADVKKQRSDPYVKSYLLPGKEKMGKRKTAVRKKTLNPAYNEILRYKINKQVLLTQKLNLSVWHNDTFGRNSFLGEVDIDLATWDWSNKHMNWYALQPRTPAAGIGLENRGEISIALKYTTTPPSGKNTAPNGEVHIWVKSCSNLPILRGNRINSFVKCTVLPDTSRKSRQKTRTVDKTANPVFNHTMVYDGFRPEDLREACVELTVWDHNRLANHFLGGLRLGLGSGKSYGTPVDWMDSTAYESSLWKKMINQPNDWVEDTLQLRMLMMAKMTK